MTREHVIPGFIYAFQKKHTAFSGWSESAGKIISAEQTIKDVCAECNNQKLGSLDAAAKTVLEGAGILVPNYVKRDITLKFNFSEFFRWLLKVSYNSARCQKELVPGFEGLVPFMLDGTNPPGKNQIILFVQLLGSHVLTEEEGPINPFVVRLCWLKFSRDPGYRVRLNIFGPLAIYIMFVNEGTLAGHVAVHKRRFIKRIPGAVELKPSVKVLSINQSTVSFFDIWENQLRRQAGW